MNVKEKAPEARCRDRDFFAYNESDAVAEGRKTGSRRCGAAWRRKVEVRITTPREVLTKRWRATHG